MHGSSYRPLKRAILIIPLLMAIAMPLSFNDATGIWPTNETGDLIDYTGGTFIGTATEFGDVPRQTGWIGYSRGPFSSANKFNATGKAFWNGSDAFAISLWIQANDTIDSDQTIMHTDMAGGGYYLFYLDYYAGTSSFRFRQAASGSAYNTNLELGRVMAVGDWVFLVLNHYANGTVEFVINATGATNTTSGTTAGTRPSLYSVGTTGPGVGSAQADELEISQFAFWNQTLTASDILWLWNSGVGQSIESDNVVNYVSTVYEISNQTFNVTFSNVTLYSYSNVNLTYNNTVYPALQIDSDTWGANITMPFLMSNQDTKTFWFNWTRNVSGSNGSSLHTQTINYSLSMKSAIFSPSAALPGESVASYLQVNNFTSLFTITSIYLNRSGTLYTGTQDTYNGTLNYHATLTAPQPAGDAASYGMNWTAVVYYSGQTRYQKFDAGSLAVNNLIITFCNDANLTAAVYRTFDETTWAYLNYSNYSARVSVTRGSLSRNFSASKNYAQNLSICVYPTSANYTADITIYYSNTKSATDTFAQRQWHNYNLRIDNVTKWINIYLLNSTHEYQVEIDTRDVNNLLATNILVVFQKFNYSLNEYVNMTSIYSGVDAESTTLLNQYNTPYRVIVMDSDSTILNTYSEYFIVESPTIFRTSTSYTNYVQLFEDITVGCTYSNVTKVLSCSYNDPNSILTQIRFEVVESGLWSKPTICNETLNNTYSGTFTCDLTGVDAATKGFTYKIIGRLSANQAYLLLSGNIEKSMPTMFGASGLFLAMLVWMAIFFIGTWNPEVAIGVSVLGFMIAIWLGLIDVGTDGGMIFTAGLAMSFAVLIIWRMKS